MADWFTQNAPKPASPPSGDWFAQNAPKPEAEVAAAPPSDSALSKVKKWGKTAVDVGTTNALQGIGLPTLSEGYDKLFPPVEEKGAFSQASEASRRIARTVPELADFALTPLGAATAATGGAPAAVKAGVGAGFSTDIATQQVPEAYKTFRENPTAGNAVDLLKAAAFVALPFAHSGNAKIRQKLAERKAAQEATKTKLMPAVPPPPGPADAGPVRKGATKTAAESAEVFAEPRLPKSAAESADVLLQSPAVKAADTVAAQEAAQLARDRAAGPIPPSKPLYQEAKRTGERPVPTDQLVAATEAAAKAIKIPPKPKFGNSLEGRSAKAKFDATERANAIKAKAKAQQDAAKAKEKAASDALKQKAKEQKEAERAQKEAAKAQIEQAKQQQEAAAAELKAKIQGMPPAEVEKAIPDALKALPDDQLREVAAAQPEPKPTKAGEPEAPELPMARDAGAELVRRQTPPLEPFRIEQGSYEPVAPEGENVRFRFTNLKGNVHEDVMPRAKWNELASKGEPVAPAKPVQPAPTVAPKPTALPVRPSTEQLWSDKVAAADKAQADLDAAVSAHERARAANRDKLASGQLDVPTEEYLGKLEADVNEADARLAQANEEVEAFGSKNVGTEVLKDGTVRTVFDEGRGKPADVLPFKSAKAAPPALGSEPVAPGGVAAAGDVKGVGAKPSPNSLRAQDVRDRFLNKPLKDSTYWDESKPVQEWNTLVDRYAKYVEQGGMDAEPISIKSFYESGRGTPSAAAGVPEGGGAKPEVAPPAWSVKQPSTAKVLKVIPNVEDGTEVHVAKGELGYSVSLKDADAGEFLGVSKVYKTEGEALKAADAMAKGKEAKPEPVRTTPAPSTPERIKLDTEDAAAEKAHSDLQEKRMALEKDRDRSGRATKRYEMIDAKVQKLKDQENEAWRKYDILRKQTYQARLEDGAEQTENQPLRIASQYKLRGEALQAKPYNQKEAEQFQKDYTVTLDQIKAEFTKMVPKIEDRVDKYRDALSAKDNEEAIKSGVGRAAEDIVMHPLLAGEDLPKRLAGFIYGDRSRKLIDNAEKQMDGLEGRLKDEGGVLSSYKMKDLRQRIRNSYGNVDENLKEAQEYVESAVKAKQAADADIAEAEVLLAKKLRPIDEVKATSATVWQGNVAASGRFVTDGKILFDSDAIPGKRLNAIAARASSGKGTGTPQGTIEGWFGKIAKGTEPVETLGQAGELKGTAYFVQKDGSVIAAPADSIAWAKSVSGATEIRSQKNKALVLYKDGKPVAAVSAYAPGKFNAINLKAARETAAGFEPPSNPLAAASVRNAKAVAERKGKLKGESGAINPAMLGLPQMQRAFNAVPPTTPGEVYAKSKIAERESARSMGRIEGAWNKVKNIAARGKTELVDATAPILDAIDKAQKKHGYEIRPLHKFEYVIDKSYRAKSMAAEFMKDKGLIDIIQKVDDVDYFEQYLIAKQAADVSAHGFETGRDAVRDAAMVREFDNRVAVPATANAPAITYRQMAKKVTDYSSDLLDYSVDSGVISADLATRLKQMYKDYVPIWRVFAEIEKSNRHQGSGKAVASLGSQTIVQKLRGSEREIENPLGSLVLKTSDVFMQGERNKAAATLASYRTLPGLEGSIWEPAQGDPVPKHTISYFEDGVKKTLGTTKEWEAAAKSLDRKDLGLIGQIFAAPARVFKTFTTGVSAPFTASNLAVDQLTTLATSKYEKSLLNPQAFGRAFLSAFSPKHTHLWDEVVKQGGGFTSFDIYRNEPMRNIEEVRANRGVPERAAYTILHPIRSMGDLLRLAEDTVSRTEQFGRARVYEMTKEALLKEGRTPADAQALAAIESNNRLPNYLRFGNAMRALNAAVPYLNASVQGTRSYLRALKENPASAIARTALTFYFPMAMATIWNLSDPERKKVYEDIPAFEKENNLIWIPPGSQKDSQGRYEVYKIKLTPGLNQLTVPLRRGLEQMYGLDPVQFGEIGKSLFEFGSPIPWGTKALTSVPQALKPTVQAVANYDFFREKPIVPWRKEGLPPALQTYPWTSGTAKLIGGRLGTSPIKTEQFIRDTVGGVAPQILNASDRGLAAVGAIPKEDIGGEGMLSATLSRFTKARGGEQEHRVFDALRKVEDKAVAVEVAKTRKSMAFRRAKDETEQIKLIERASARAKARVSSQLTPIFKKMSAEQKMAKVNRVGKVVERQARLAGILP